MTSRAGLILSLAAGAFLAGCADEDGKAKQDEHVAKTPGSHTGRFLAPLLGL